VLAGDRCERCQRAVEQLAVGIQQHRDAVPRPLEPGVAGRAEAGVAGQRDHLGAALRGQVRPAVAGAAVDGDDVRWLRQVSVDRVEQRP
jgi:hypothetical protein